MPIIVNSGPSTELLNPVILASSGQRFDYLSRKQSKFALFFRSNTPGVGGRDGLPTIGDAKNPTFSGALFEEWNDTSGDRGGDYCQVPVFGKLYKAFVAGTQPAMGTGEAPPIYNRNMYLSQGVKVFSRTQGLAAQRTPMAILNAANNEKSFLSEWWGEMQDGNIQLSLLTGYDAVLSLYAQAWSIPGIGSAGIESSITPFSHPNMFIPDAGPVSYANGRPASQGYENSVLQALQGYIGNTTYIPTVARILDGDDMADDQNIPKLKTSMGDFRVWFMDKYTLRILQQDKRYEDIQKKIFQGTSNDPDSYLIHRASAIIMGQIIYEIPGCWGVQSTNAGIVTNTKTSLTMPQYGPSGSFWLSEDGTTSGLDTNVIKMAFICSPHCLHKLYGRKRLWFATGPKDQNFEPEPQEIAMWWRQPWIRDDVFDARGETQTAGAFKINTSSAVMPFYSPRRYQI